jgi:hypothetical protein
VAIPPPSPAHGIGAGLAHPCANSTTSGPVGEPAAPRPISLTFGGRRRKPWHRRAWPTSGGGTRSAARSGGSRGHDRPRPTPGPRSGAISLRGAAIRLGWCRPFNTSTSACQSLSRASLAGIRCSVPIRAVRVTADGLSVAPREPC